MRIAAVVLSAALMVSAAGQQALPPGRQQPGAPPPAPGEYYLCALTELDLQMRSEPEYLEQLIAASAKITLGEGEKKQQNLQVGSR